MATTTIVTRRISGAGGEPVEAQQSFTTTSVTAIDEPILGNATDFVINLAVDVSAISAVMLYCAESALTIVTNAAGAGGDDTLTLAAGQPYLWALGDEDACLLTVDITKLYVTNTGLIAGTLRVRVAQDPTPP